MAGASHEEIGDIQKAHRNRAIGRAIILPPAGQLPPPPFFSGRLPRILNRRPQFIFPCRELEDLCPQPRSRCRDWGNSARNLNPFAAFLNAFAANFSAFARNLAVLAANPPPPAAIYNLLPQSKLCEIATKKRKMRKQNPHPSCRTPSPIGWERDGGRGFLTINHQLQTIN